MSRPAYLRPRDEADQARAAATAARPTLADLLADRDAAVYRIRCDTPPGTILSPDLLDDIRRSHIWVYDAAHRPMYWDSEQCERAIQTAYTLRPDVDWRRRHDFYPATGDVLLSPDDPDEDGWSPDEDGVFGGTAPVLRAARC